MDGPTLFLAFELSNGNLEFGFTTALGQKAREKTVPAGGLPKGGVGRGAKASVQAAAVGRRAPP